MVRIRQRFDANHLADPRAALEEQLVRLKDAIRPGASIAIGVGSRGICALPVLVRTTVDFVQGCGGLPFIVPAMGSHGGASADGQLEVLRLNGISEEAMGAPVRSSMEVVEIPRGPLAHPLFMDRHAYESDGVILINRIKPHSDYHGPYESGLMKMSVVGLGKLEGALAIHAFGVQGLQALLGPAAHRILATGKILGGVALVENACHKTMIVKVLKADEIPGEEPSLLEAATQNMAALPAHEIDVLIIDRMGKDISGVGLDPNVTGRIGVRGQPDGAAPRVKAIVVTDLTDASHGNGIGVGLADVITRRLHDKIDRAETYRNVITSSFLERGKIPIVADTDQQAVDIALRSCGHIPDGRARIMRIPDTLSLGAMDVSEAIAEEIRGSPRISVIAEDVGLFDDAGMLLPF